MAGETTEAEKSPCRICRARKDFKKPVPWLDFGADLRSRVRHQAHRRLLAKDVRGERLMTRHRARAWTRITPIEDLQFNLRVVTEPRYFCKPDRPKQIQRHEALIDILNVKWSKAFGLPLTITAGRQEINLGGGWLVLDGTPGDGSRTRFFDAVRLTLKLDDIKTTIDGVFIDNYADSAKRIRPFNDRDVMLSEQDARGVIVWVNNKSLPETEIDGYFIYKRDRRVRDEGSQGDIYTFGLSAKHTINQRWKYYIEAAPQFGRKNGHEQSAFAAKTRLAYSTRDAWNSNLFLEYEYGSGDDNPDKYFDRLWGRDLSWEVYEGGIDSLDSRPSFGSNLHRIQFGLRSKPLKDVELRADYHFMLADENTMLGGTNGLSKGGCIRGHLFAVQLRHKVNEHFKHRIQGEIFLPGDYYGDTRNDVATYVRYEIVLSW